MFKSTGLSVCWLVVVFALNEICRFNGCLKITSAFQAVFKVVGSFQFLNFSFNLFWTDRVPSEQTLQALPLFLVVTEKELMEVNDPVRMSEHQRGEKGALLTEMQGQGKK